MRVPGPGVAPPLQKAAVPGRASQRIAVSRKLRANRILSQIRFIVLTVHTVYSKCLNGMFFCSFFDIFALLSSFAVSSICTRLCCVSAQFCLSLSKQTKALLLFVQSDGNWWKGTCKGRTGLIPSNYGEQDVLIVFFSVLQFLFKSLNTSLFPALVAEKSESIDNPIHEAAKRGATLFLELGACLCVFGCC